MCGCTHTVVRITAAVYEALRPILNEMSQRIDNGLDSIRDDLMKVNQNLTEQIISNARYTCGGTGGWRRAVYLDMTDPNTNCPSGWQLTGYSKRTCGRATDGYYTCDSVLFPVSGGPYRQVCGRIRAYQYLLLTAFWAYNREGQTTIDSAYFDGVALLHGSPRQHVWTFADGLFENYASHVSNCPCDNADDIISIPSFVGSDYFCESGYVYPGYRNGSLEHAFHSNDILWDGRDCHSTSTCCSLHNPPFFAKTLSQTTTDDLELRMCLKNPSSNIAVEFVELYVK